MLRDLNPSLRLLAILILLYSPSVFAESFQNDIRENFKLGSGDVIKISVYDELDLYQEAMIGDSGTLDYPFLGKIRVVGLTVEELQEKITQGLKGDYLINPRVSVSVIEYRPFYINGQVKRPGGYPFQAGLTVDKAISLASGFTERANKKSIYIQSEDNVESRKRVGLESTVKPGDVITIEESFF